MNINEFVPALLEQAGVYSSQLVNSNTTGDDIFPWRTPTNGGNGINKGNVLDRFSVRSSCNVVSVPRFNTEGLARFTLVTDGQKRDVEKPEGELGPHWKIDGATYALLIERQPDGLKIARIGIWKGADLTEVLRVAVTVSKIGQ